MQKILLQHRPYKQRYSGVQQLHSDRIKWQAEENLFQQLHNLLRHFHRWLIQRLKLVPLQLVDSLQVEQQECNNINQEKT